MEEELGAFGKSNGLLKTAAELSLFVPFLYPTNLAIPVSVKARVLKMAALYDLPLTMNVLQEEVFDKMEEKLPKDLLVIKPPEEEGEGPDGKDAGRKRRASKEEKFKTPADLPSFIAKIKEELAANVSEEVAA